MSEEPQIAGFRIRERVGKGGTATVWLADDQTGVPVAIKAINADLPGGAELCEQFTAESAVIGRLRNPGIIRIYRYGQDGPWHYLVTEYLPGGDLKSRIGKGMTVDQAIEVTRRIASALDAAHEAGLVHQDVKPENVLFRSNGTPVLMDFGIASQSGVANAGMRGTPLYMSPEQVQAKRIDRRTDIYSLGCMLFEMLTGAPPYPMPTMEAILYAQVHKPVPRLPADLQSLQGLIDRMMAKALDDRVGSAKELLELLDEHWLLAPQRMGDDTGAAHHAPIAPPTPARELTPGRAVRQPLAEEEEVSDPWLESYELARTYLVEGDMQAGRSLLLSIATQARGEVQQLAREMLYQLG